LKVRWSVYALADREEIFRFLEATSPRAALVVDERIADQAERLSQFPDRGRLGRVSGTRELVIRRTPYIAAYRVTADAVVIVRVLHGAMVWPEQIPEIL